jgi:hypothetical protein
MLILNKRTTALVLVTAAILAASMALGLSAPLLRQASAGVAQATLVNSTPVAYTPHLKTGYIVHENAVVGGTVYVGGQFTQFESADRKITYDRQNFVAYSTTTGAISPLILNFDRDVYALIGSPDGQSLYIGGKFRNVNGVARTALVKVNLSTGTIDSSFKWALGGQVRDLQYARGSLYVSGIFSKHIVAVDPATGVDTGQINVSVSGSLSGYATRVDRFALNPTGTDLVAIGDFTSVNGVSRNSAFRLALGAKATLQTWHPRRFDVKCASSIPYFLRDVEWSPDGLYFVIVSTGGPAGGYPATGFCDAAGRWEASSVGDVAEPTWINWTGGDSLYSVAVSGAAVYVGGHQRWLDNPSGRDSAGPGAYAVDSIGAIDPMTGKAIRTWNAMPMTRAHGKEDLTLYGQGLVVGGDGTTIKGAYHAGTAIFPLS